MFVGQDQTGCMHKFNEVVFGGWCNDIVGSVLLGIVLMWQSIVGLGLIEWKEPWVGCIVTQASEDVLAIVPHLAVGVGEGNCASCCAKLCDGDETPLFELR